MKVALLLFLCSLFSVSVYAQGSCCTDKQMDRDSCALFGHMKQHNGMMRVTGPFRCLDSMNFTVQPQRPMPFNCMMGDTVWMRVCLRAHDGKLHQTTIYYGTDQGTVSFEVAMQAAGTSIVPINLAPRITMALYPNPTMDRVFINLSDVLPEPMTIEIVDLKGIVIRSHAMPRESSINTRELPIGTYHLVLRSYSGAMIATEDLVVLR